MICTHCREKNHDACIEENQGKTPSACDCQHRVKPGAPPVLSPEIKDELVKIFPVQV